ncbi:MAG: succinate dehydrogenase hydrophobic membrane anchor subunit [Salinibacter sp.]
MASSKSNALNWFLHRITGTFLIFMLITHFWVQHYDHQVASVTAEVVTEKGEMPEYPKAAKEAVKARMGADAKVTPYQVVMQRLNDPVYAVLWKGFNILFLVVALHHGFYGLNNVMTDYIRNPMGRLVAKSLSWTVALGLLIIGVYSVITAGW